MMILSILYKNIWLIQLRQFLIFKIIQNDEIHNNENHTYKQKSINFLIKDLFNHIIYNQKITYKGGHRITLPYGGIGGKKVSFQL